MAENVLVSRLKRYFTLEGILVLVISDFFFLSGTNIWSPYLNIYYSSIGLSAFDIGIIATLQNAVSSLTMIPGGIIADRIGRKKPIAFSFVLTFIYTVALTFIHDYQSLLAITCIQGLAIGLRTPALTAYILDVVLKRRGIAFATFHLFELLATILGIAVGASIAEALGYLSAFQAGATIILVAGIFTFLRLKESMAQTTGHSTPVNKSLKDGISLMRNPSILLLVTGSVIHQVATSFAIPYLGMYLKNILIIDLVLVGILLNARQIGDLIGQLPSGTLIDRFGAEAVLFLHVFMTAPIVYFFGSTNNPYILFLILLVWGSEAGWDIPSRRLLISKYSEGVGSATALGAVQSFIGLIALLSPALGGWIWDNLGANFLFQISALVNAVGCIPLLTLVIKARKKNKKASSATE